MRLLKTKRYELVEANDIPEPFPQYAILSHTWISPKDEITYQDIKKRKEDIENDLFKQKGWAKLRRYCDRAAKDGWDWAWMDTCCIDKTSPADTQEAINAMFRWYQNAGICYAYLDDVDVNVVFSTVDSADVNDPKHVDLDSIAGADNVVNRSSFRHKALSPFITKAKWFTRGWTLQELLAPHYLVFLDRAWRRIGIRESWADEIKEASRIETRHLTEFSPTDFNSCSIAMRLSWASRRDTTIEEDETYSLLGLFGISLPLIYGEGRWRAFNRLQRELITVYNDDSIFAWKVEQTSKNRISRPQSEDNNSRWGILAPSIRQFWDASNIKAFGHYGDSFSMTNRGLEIKARRWRSTDDPTLCLVRLNCGVRDDAHIGLSLSHVDDSYDRIRIDELCDMEKIKPADWKEELDTESILIRASNFSKLLGCRSIFALEYPEQIKIGLKYFVDFHSSSLGAKMQPWDDKHMGRGLEEDELLMETNQLIFINIEVRHEGIKSEFDVIINLTETGYPSAGIMGRDLEQWKRLEDPLKQSSPTYEALAEHLHYKVPNEPVYPVTAMEATESLAIGVFLFPRPPQRRTLKLLPGSAKSARLREYVLKISVDQDDDGQRDNLEQQNQKRRRIL